MLIIYYTNFKENKEDILKYLNYVSIYKRKRIKQLLKTARRLSAYQTLLGEILLKYILIEKYKMHYEEIDIKVDANGKPFLNNCEINFNISHSEHMVLCGVDKSPLGVDVEKIETTKLIHAEIFSACEAYLKLEGSVEKVYTLYHSYVKGNCDMEINRIVQQQKKGGYVISVASETFLTEKKIFQMQEVTYNALFKNIRL